MDTAVVLLLLPLKTHVTVPPRPAPSYSVLLALPPEAKQLHLTGEACALTAREAGKWNT